MKAFWIVVSFVFIAVVVALDVTAPRFRSDWPIATTVTRYLSMGTLVAIIWAIFFRSQIEKLRVSLASLFVLILMEAILLLAIRVFRPF